MDLRASSDIRRQLEADRRRERRFHILMASCLGVFLAAAFGFGVYAVKVGLEGKRRFMTQCMEDHKEYECTVLWRAGGSSSDAPTIIFMPTGR